MNNVKLTKEQSDRINIYKFLLTIMVVYIHSYSTQLNFASGSVTLDTPMWLENFKYIISQVVFRCAVPGFFLISAFFLYRKDFSWKDNLKRKCKSLGVPYLILNLVWIGIYYVAQELTFTRDFFMNSDFFIKDWDLLDFCNAFLGYRGEGSYPFLAQLWFVRDLLVLNILAKVIWKLIDKAPNVVFIVTLAFWLFGETTGIFCLSNQAICFWVFGGVLVKKKINYNKIDEMPIYILGIVYALWVLLDMLTLETVLYRPIHRFVIFIGIVFWYSFTKTIKEGMVKKIILNLSVYNFAVYIFHEYTLTFSKKVCLKVLPMSWLSQLLQYICLPIAVIGVCIIFSACFKKVLPKLYYLIVGGRA